MGPPQERHLKMECSYCHFCCRNNCHHKATSLKTWRHLLLLTPLKCLSTLSVVSARLSPGAKAFLLMLHTLTSLLISPRPNLSETVDKYLLFCQEWVASWMHHSHWSIKKAVIPEFLFSFHLPQSKHCPQKSVILDKSVGRTQCPPASWPLSGLNKCPLQPSSIHHHKADVFMSTLEQDENAQALEHRTQWRNGNQSFLTCWIGKKTNLGLKLCPLKNKKTNISSLWERRI